MAFNMGAPCAHRPCLHVPEQKITFDLRVCGKLTECMETWNWQQSPRPLRGECLQPFSKASRLRLLREIAQIHWTDQVRYSLITLTYPDEAAERSIARHTIDRSRFVRDLEQLTGRGHGVMWRKEWKPRLTGHRKGQFTAHWHLLVFDIGWVDAADVRRIWKSILATGGPVATDVREAKSGDQAAMYAAKYSAKATSCSLDYAAYLNRRWGRAWGFLRKVLIPYYKPTIIRDLSKEELALVKALASAQWKGVPRGADQGFSLFGGCGEAIAKSVLKMRLAKARRAV